MPYQGIGSFRMAAGASRRDGPPMTTEPTTPQSSTPRPRRLLRSRGDHLIGGVAGGLGEYFRVDAVVFRIGFVVASLFGGAGFLAYLLAVAFVPRDDGTGQPTAGDTTSRRLLKIAGIAAVVITVLVAAAGLIAVSAWAAATGAGAVIAGIVVLTGIVLAAAAGRGRAGRHIAIAAGAVAIVLALPAALVAASGIDVDGGIGERTYRPSLASDLPRDGYELGVGKLVVDLRDLPWAPGDDIDLDLGLGLGQASVLVPDGVCVASDSDIGVGYANILGEEDDGVDIDQQISPPRRGGTPRLTLHGDLGAGALEVVHSLSESNFGDHRQRRFGRGPGDDEPVNAACAA